MSFIVGLVVCVVVYVSMQTRREKIQRYEDSNIHTHTHTYTPHVTTWRTSLSLVIIPTSINSSISAQVNSS